MTQHESEDAGVRTSLGSLVACLRDTNDHAEPIGVEREMVLNDYVRRIMQEDDFALADLFEETSALVLATALRVLNFRADAEEVTVDVFARVWRTANCYDPRRGRVDAWLVSIARSRAMDRLRSRTTRDRYEAATPICGSSDVDPESSAAASQTSRYLLQALDALPFEQRRVIKLAYFADLTMAEIANQLGHPIGSVKTRIRTGLIKLRRKLAAVA